MRCLGKFGSPHAHPRYQVNVLAGGQGEKNNSHTPMRPGRAHVAGFDANEGDIGSVVAGQLRRAVVRGYRQGGV